jgi:hypothetical protein
MHFEAQNEAAKANGGMYALMQCLEGQAGVFLNFRKKAQCFYWQYRTILRWSVLCSQSHLHNCVRIPRGKEGEGRASSW